MKEGMCMRNQLKMGCSNDGVLEQKVNLSTSALRELDDRHSRDIEMLCDVIGCVERNKELARRASEVRRYMNEQGHVVRVMETRFAEGSTSNTL